MLVFSINWKDAEIIIIIIVAENEAKLDTSKYYGLNDYLKILFENVILFLS